MAVRQAARAAGYADREVHFIERGFDWDELLRDAANLSLFASRRLIELKFNSTPDVGVAARAGGARGAAAGRHRAAGDRRTRAQAAGDRLGQGIRGARRARRHAARRAWSAAGLDPRSPREAGRADRRRGNGADRRSRRRQPARRAAGSRAHRAADAGRDARRGGRRRAGRRQRPLRRVRTVGGGFLRASATRALRILAGLRAEGQEPPLIIWALLQDLRALSRVSLRAGRERSLDDAFRAEQVWSTRQGPLKAALARLDRRQHRFADHRGRARRPRLPRAACTATRGSSSRGWSRGSPACGWPHEPDRHLRRHVRSHPFRPPAHRRSS